MGLLYLLRVNYVCFIIAVALLSNAGHGLLILEVFFLDHTQRRTTVGGTPLDE